jgi:hypothetical protein
MISHSKISPSAVRVVIASLGILFGATTVHAADTVDLHSQTWYVHTDMVTGAQDLPYWQEIIDTALAEANALVEGTNGPFDTPCCSRMNQTASLAVFGASSDGLDVLDSSADQSVLDSFGSGSVAFLIDSMTYCGGSSPSAIGCASTPSCTGNGDDDPNSWMAVTVDALDSGILPAVVAHERGHNACLGHVSANACQIMQGTVTSPGNGGCFTSTECSNFRDGRTTTSSGLDCDCHIAGGGLETDGTSCTEVAGGVCSGGYCGDAGGDASVSLIASAHPGSAGTAATDDAIAISGLTGGWSILGQITATADAVHGLAYATDSTTLYGVIPTSGDDSIVTVDATTGAVIATVGSIANGTSELISMAYHPGATTGASDDRLIMLEVSGSTGTVVWIDPASPSVKNTYGNILWTPANLFAGLAYDSNQGKLYASTPFGPDGLYEIDLGTCPPSPCSSSQVSGVRVAISDGSLSYSEDSQRLYLIGTSFGGQRTFYRTIDPLAGSAGLVRNLDELTPGGLAAMPAVPEPDTTATLLVGAGFVAWLGRRQRRA